MFEQCLCTTHQTPSYIHGKIRKHVTERLSFIFRNMSKVVGVLSTNVHTLTCPVTRLFTMDEACFSY